MCYAFGLVHATTQAGLVVRFAFPLIGEQAIYEGRPATAFRR
jgi:hypothetical protein